MKNFIQKSFTLTLVLLLIYSATNGSTIYSTVYGGLWNNETTWIGEVIPGINDTAIIQGPVVVGSVIGYDTYNSFGGWVIVGVNGQLYPHEYGGGLGTFVLFVEHDITNNGELSNGAEFGEFEYLVISVNGNVTNNGDWNPYKTILTGIEQTITLGEGKSFGGWWETNGSTTINSTNNLVFDCRYYTDKWNVGDFNLNKSILHLGNFSINTTGTLIHNGTIEGNFEIKGRFSVNKHPEDTLIFSGVITVSDTLEGNEYGGGLGIQKLKIYGDIINNGVIRDKNDARNDDELSILITGDIINNGKWTCNHVNFIGSEIQYIKQNTGSEFISNFYGQDTSGNIVAKSNLTINQNFDLNGATLNMQGKTLTVKGLLNDGNINNTILHGGYIQSLASLDNLIIEGTVNCDEGNTFYNSVIVNDTLQSNAYGGGLKIFELVIEGNLINNGVIMNRPGDYLQINISGNITNNGSWINYLTNVLVSEEQYIELIDDKPIEGPVKFDAVTGSEPYQWYYDDAILDSPDFEGETARILTWNVPLSSDWYGNFYCETGEREWVGMIIKKGFTNIYENHTCNAKIWSYDNTVSIDLQEGQNGRVIIYDFTGRVINKFSIKAGSTRKYLPKSGYYIVHVTADNKVANQKIFIR